MFRSKQTCSDCHFFVKGARGLPSSTPFVLNASNEERDLAKAGVFSWAEEHYSLACHFGVWDEGFNFDRAQRYEVIVQKDRRNFCFFWHFRPGMLLPAAKVLQEREARDRDAAKDRRLTIIGLWIAAVALAIDVGLRIVEPFKLWGFGGP